MAEFISDAREFARRRVSQIQTQPDFDEKELSEREAYAQAIATENEKHLYDYLMDCVGTSTRAMLHIRQEQDELWRTYLEEEPPAFARKAKWQSRVVIPKPFTAVQFAMAVVRKAFDTEYLSIENMQNKELADFYRKLMQSQFDRTVSNFPIRFTDAAGMGFVVGTSMEIIPTWVPGKGLQLALAEPWKIKRDPDALSRDPQSGTYWIHQEWVQYYILRELEKSGRYKGVANLAPYTAWETSSYDYRMDKVMVDKRKDMVWHRSRYQNLFLVSEFWGHILDPKGELLMPNATYTVAGNRVIAPPKRNPYRNLRWPGIAFSPIPHFLRFDGRGILKGVKRLWEYMCALLALHNDNLNWAVNPEHEVNQMALVNQGDLDRYPGKLWVTRETTHGEQVVRPVAYRSITGDILANLNYGGQLFDEGSLVNAGVKGLPGYRAEVTAREAAQNLDQSMTVFGLIGKNLEDGALQIAMAAFETVAMNISMQELSQFMGKEAAMQFMDMNSPLMLKMPPLDGSFHISGISAMMRDWEVVKSIRDVVLPLFTPGSPFPVYLKAYNVLKSIETRLGLKDEDILIEQDRADAIDQQQQEAQEAEIQQARQAKDLELQGQQAEIAAAGAEGQAPPTEEAAQMGQLQRDQEAHMAEQGRAEEVHSAKLSHIDEQRRAMAAKTAQINAQSLQQAAQAEAQRRLTLAQAKGAGKAEK